jgi:hypothetical protein
VLKIYGESTVVRERNISFLKFEHGDGRATFFICTVFEQALY